jgi:predicted molibdopterin-dependent oxidoreductase YjgC
MIRATINNRVYEFAEGISILDAARSVGIEVPTLCHDLRLKPIGSCRMCLVEIEGRPHPQTSCNTLLSDGMVIATHTPALEHERQMLLRMLAQDHPPDVFAQFPDKQFHRLASRKSRQVDRRRQERRLHYSSANHRLFGELSTFMK